MLPTPRADLKPNTLTYENEPLVKATGFREYDARWLLGSEISRRFGAAGLPDDTISLTFFGSAGQSFGAFVPHGVTMRLYGDANDYFGKGLSGGRLIVRPPDRPLPK